MLEKIIPHRYIYLFFLAVLLFGISTGKIFMSIGTIGISVNWFFEGKFSNKIALIKRHKYSSLVLSMSYFVHILWLLNTENFNYASKDLLVKLPLFLIPLVIGSTRALNKKELIVMIQIFLVGVFFSTIISTLVYFNIIPPKVSGHNTPQISLFMSHIRMGLLVAFTSLLLLYFFFFTNIKYKKISLVLAVWMVVFLFFLQSITAIIAWVVGFTVLAFWGSYKTKILSKVVLISWFVVMAVSFCCLFFIQQDFYHVKDKRELANLPVKTISGERYVHDTINNYTENGYYVWVGIAPNEVKKAWNKVSEIDIDSTDAKGQKIRCTLYRYLTSKGLYKDEQTINNLSKKEIIEIESGKTSAINYSRFEERIRGILLELQLYFDGIETDGHSISQRLLFFEIGKKIIKKNLLFGVGIGDINDAFKTEYLNLTTDLSKENQMRSHNQFLSYFIVYGLVGFLLWLFTVAYPVFIKKKPQPIYIIFLLIMLVGFLSDDMLERQAGVAIYITINSILLFGIYSIDGGSKVLDLTNRTPSINS